MSDVGSDGGSSSSRSSNSNSSNSSNSSRDNEDLGELTQLVYFSSSSPAPYSRDDLRDILSTSRRNNAHLNITGLLLYHNGSILQILEGDENAVKMLYTRIERDVRHRGVMPIVRRKIQRRDFGCWRMGFKDVSDEEREQLDGYSDLLTSAQDMKRRGEDEAEMSLPVQRLINSYRKVRIPFFPTTVFLND